MLKLLIVEDERREREGLVDFLNWGNLGIEIAGTARDGIEGIEMAEKILPDIILTDIKMPGMDGIAMSKKIKVFLPEVKIIILTGYDDFRFAREAISFNANGYLLKPVEEKEILELIKKIIQSCKDEKYRLIHETHLLEQINEQMGIVKEKILLDLYEGKLANPKHQKLLDKLEAYTGACSYVAFGIKFMDKYIDVSETNDNLILEGYLKKEDIEQIFSSGSHVLKLNDGIDTEYYIYIPLINESDDLEKEIEKVKEYFEKKPDMNVFIGIGKCVKSLYNIHQSCLQARAAMEFGIFWDSPGIIQFKEVENLQSEFVNVSGEFLLRGNYYSKQIIFSVMSADLERIYEIINELFSFINMNKGATKDFICNFIYGLINEVAILLYGMNEDMESILGSVSDLGKQILLLNSFSCIKRFITRLYEKVIEHLLDKRNNKDEHIVKKVMQLVEKKYMTDINLKTVAAEVFLSPNYLGNLFKKGTGKTFNEYLTEYRMEKAKDLLQYSKNKVSRVAKAVGIPNTSYFCVVFKNTYGTTPGEYQEMLMNTSKE